jgi:spermidine synthase
MENCYEEKQPWGSTFYTVIPGSYMFMKTERAKVEFITNPHFGRMLFIDNVLQSATADEHIYHNGMASFGFLKKQKQKKILIAGSAEGALLREIQDIDAREGLGVEEMIMVDWDEQLVKYMMEEEPWSRGSFDDERVKVVYSDIEEYLNNDTNTYTTVYLDLLDPETEEEEEWLDKIKENAMEKLEKDGCLVMNVGKSRRWDSEAGAIRKEIVVPSFQEVWGLVKFEKKE